MQITTNCEAQVSLTSKLNSLNEIGQPIQF